MNGGWLWKLTEHEGKNKAENQLRADYQAKEQRRHQGREAIRWTEQIAEMSMRESSRGVVGLQVLNCENCSNTSREVYAVAVSGAIIRGQAWSYEDAKHLSQHFLPSGAQSTVFVATLASLS